MAVTQADVDALNAAIAAGERQVSIGGQSITYQTIDSLIKARNDMRNELLNLNPVKRPKQTYVYHDGRGYDS